MRFIGNKTRILHHIESVIEENQIKGEIFCDLFAGSGAVGDNFKHKYQIISNDYLYSMTIINKAKLYNKTKPKFSKFFRIHNISPFEYLNNKTYIYHKKFFMTKYYTELGDRMYFTEENAIKIDGMRIEIENLYKNEDISKNEYYFLLASLIESVMGVSNTTGTYEAFLKHWDNRALKSFVIEPLEMNITKNVNSNNKVYNEDSNHLIRELSGDILYLDTPYTVTDYSHAYHLLETLTKYDYPDLRGITGRRIAPNHKSKYTRKNQALVNFEDLLRQADFEHILISYSTQALIPIEELIELAKKFAINNEVQVNYFPYREYKNIRTSKKGKNLKEVILYFKKDNSIIKSPLNYTGSKDTMIDNIRKQLPRTISTFVDIMGGAFNVGVNMVVNNKVVYNEFLPHVYEIIKLTYTSDKETLIKKIEERIEEFGLEKGNKDKFTKFREYYNKDKNVLDLFILQMYCFQNQMRFNSKLEFNTPVGNSSYNETTRERITLFLAKTKIVEFFNGSYDNIDLDTYDKDTLFYFDPPYFITSAAYNDGKRGFEGWDADKEVELLEFIQQLNSKGYKFMLSNVVQHKDKTNNILLKWIQTHKFNITQVNGVGSKNRRNEVIITNYDWREP